jgi:hypothetical protein
VVFALLILTGFLLHVGAIEWDTVVKNNMHDPKFRKAIEEWLDLEFPASAQWEESEYRAWQEIRFHCVFTLPKKDVDLMFSQESITWYENDHDHLPQWSDTWLKKKKLEHFKVMKYELPINRFVTVVIDNPHGINDDQRVWVYIYCHDW